MAAPRLSSIAVDTSQDPAFKSPSTGQTTQQTISFTPATTTQTQQPTVTINTQPSSGSPFLNIGPNSLAQILKDGNTVDVYQAKDATYVSAYAIEPTQQFITNDVNLPGGNNLSVQFNFGGELSGSAALTFDPSNGTFSAPTIIANTTTITSPANLKLDGGNAGYFLQTVDGNGNLIWAAAPAAGNGAPGGSPSQVQYYGANGLFAGTNLITIDNANNSVTITGNLNAPNTSLITANTQIANTQVSNTLVIGNSVANAISSTKYFSINTTTTAPDQVLLNIPKANVSSIDFNVTGYQAGGNIKQVSKVIALTLGNETNYNEYGVAYINGQAGDFSVDQSGSNVRLLVTPASANLTQFNIVYTVYNNY